MRIAFVNQPIDTVLPPYQNSVGACTYGAAGALAATHQVTVYALQERNNIESMGSRTGMQFRFLPTSIADKALYKFQIKASKLLQVSSQISTSPFLYPDYGWAVAREMAKERFDVIHIQHCSQYVPMVRKLNPKSKVVLQMHSEWFSQSRPSRLARRLRGLDLLTSVSDHIARKTLRDLPNAVSQCETVYNGIDATEFAAERERPNAARKVKRIIYAGGVSPHKGIHVLLDAFEIVAKQYPDVHLNIIGPPGSYPFEETFDLQDTTALKQMAPFYRKSRLGYLKDKLTGSARGLDNYDSMLRAKASQAVADKVSFLGMIPRPELVRHYYESDIFAFPPIWDEGFGIPPVEAMAAGTPVVATRSGGVVETVQDGKSGLFVEKNDSQSLAEALLTLLSNDALREKMGRAARERAMKCFTWGHTAARLSELYEALCAGEPKGHPKTQAVSA